MSGKKHMVILSGAGISAESGIPTFRGSDGLWEGYDITEVASPKGWNRNKETVLDFYNQRRRAIVKAKPNAAHRIIAELESDYDVTVITQNIDDLHERAGSKNVVHLHGEIKKARSTKDPSKIYLMEGTELNIGDCCELGSQLRPHIVWFGEAVPLIEPAFKIVQTADILIIIGTSLQVYPAASLVSGVTENTPIYVIDPNSPDYPFRNKITSINKSAVEGMKELKEVLKR